MAKTNAKDYQRWRRLGGRHHMYCAVRDKKVIIGEGAPDGDFAYFTKAQAPPDTDPMWEKLDGGPATDAKAMETVTSPDGTLKVEEVSKGWYNVINTATGQPVNTSKLRKAEAEAMVAGSPPEDNKGDEE